MLACIPSATLHGVDGRSVSVEVHVSAGLPGFTVVGLPDAAVRESRDRVRVASLSSRLSGPSRRVTVNLAPARFRMTLAASATSLAHRKPRCEPTRCCLHAVASKSDTPYQTGAIRAFPMNLVRTPSGPAGVSHCR